MFGLGRLLYSLSYLAKKPNLNLYAPGRGMPRVNYAVRLTESYESLRTTVASYALKADSIVVYEHPELNNVHCHMLLMGVYVTDQNLKDIMKAHGVGLKGAGQLSFKTSFKSPEKVNLDITAESALKFITYMSKGKYDPKYVKGYTDETLEQCKSEWVTYKKRSIDESLYIGFLSSIIDVENKYGVKVDDLKLLKRRALNYALTKYHVINLGCRRDAAMLWTTYAYENNLLKDVVLPFDLPEK